MLMLILFNIFLKTSKRNSSKRFFFFSDTQIRIFFLLTCSPNKNVHVYTLCIFVSSPLVEHGSDHVPPEPVTPAARTSDNRRTDNRSASRRQRAPHVPRPHLRTHTLSRRAPLSRVGDSFRALSYG